MEIPIVDEQQQNAKHSEVNEPSDKRFSSASEFATNIDNYFELKVVGGIEAGLRTKVADKMKSGGCLLPNENNAVVNSVIQAVSDQFGPYRPDIKFCEKNCGCSETEVPIHISSYQHCSNFRQILDL